MKISTSTSGQPSRPLRLKTRLLSGFAALFVIAASAADAKVKLTYLYAFTGGSNGANPGSKLLADTSGPSGALRGFYSTTNGGGGSNCSGGCGVVFKLVPPAKGKTSWTDTTLWSFTGGEDGGGIEDSGLSTTAKRISNATTFYGTTYQGGLGYGTVFSLTGRTLTTIWAFTGGSDGSLPSLGEVLATKNGTLYVAALSGGSSRSNCGTVISLTPPDKTGTAWHETTIWTFSGAADGCEPNAGLVMDVTGALYGTTIGDGYSTGRNSFGSAFKLMAPANGQTKWTLESLALFKGSDGGGPLGPLTTGKNGVFYGTVDVGGTYNEGYAFELLPPRKGETTWKKNIIYMFGDGVGEYPWEGQFIIDKNGILYNTTSGGYFGTVYKLAPPSTGHGLWTATTLYGSPSVSAGYEPLAGLFADKYGTLYGTFRVAAPTGNGFVFSLTGTGFAPP